MLANIPATILHDMDNLLDTQTNDADGKRLSAIADFLKEAADFFAQQCQQIADPSMRHNAVVLSRGFAAGRLIVERAGKDA